MTLYEAQKEYEKFIQLELNGITPERYLSDLRIFILCCKNCDVRSVGEKEIITHLQTLLDLGYAHNNVVKRSYSLRKFFAYLYNRGFPTLNPAQIPRMRLIPVEPRVSTEEDYAKLLSVIPEDNNRYHHCRNRALINLLWDTGARVGEICSLDVADIDMVKMKAVIRTEKSRGRKPFREIYWTKQTNNNLRHWILRRGEWLSWTEFQDENALFVGSSPTHIGKRFTNHAAAIMLRKYSRQAKIQTFNAHSARHHFGHDLAKQGANNSVISSLMGHANLSSSFIYTELNNTEREEMYDKYVRKDLPK